MDLVDLHKLDNICVNRSIAILLLTCFSLLGACSSGTSSESTDSEQLIPLFSEALDCTDIPESNVSSGGEFKKVTLQAEGAICNDGSPAVLYIRPADTIEGAKNWNIHFQGGSSCSGSDCAPRWCEKSGRMSSLAKPETTDFGGFLGRDPSNLRDDANQVFFYYCSSDNYTGQNNDAVISATEDTPEFRIHFKGHEIVETAMDLLEMGAISDDESIFLPSLGGDGMVTISGTSAGCVGVINNSARMAQRFKALGHDTQVVCDGSFGPDIAFLPNDDRTKNLMLFAEQVSAERDINWIPRRDDSCTEMQTDQPWRCDFASYVMANHISESPSFLRMDLGDPTLSSGYLDFGFSMHEFAEFTRAGLVDMLEENGLEQAPRPVSVFGLVCGTHVGLLTNSQYYETLLEAGLESITLNQAIEAWSDGDDISLVDTVPDTITTCPL